MKSLLSLYFVWCATLLSAQETFNKTYDKPDWDYADAVFELDNGNYLTVGSSRSQFENDYDINLLLVDLEGEVIWDKFIGQYNQNEFANSIIKTLDGNFLILGVLKEDLHPYLAKINIDGELIWMEEYPTVAYSKAYSLGELPNGNLYFLENDNQQNSRIYLSAPDGISLWTSFFLDIALFTVIPTLDGGFALTGTIDDGLYDTDMILIKTDANGVEQWRKIYGGDGKDNVRTMIGLPDGGFIIFGELDMQIPDVHPEAYFIRTDTTGEVLWTKNYQGFTTQHVAQCCEDAGYVISTKRENFFTNETNFGIAKLDNEAEIIWAKDFDGYLYSTGNNVTPTSDNGFLLAGSTSNIWPPSDMRLIKFDEDGNTSLAVEDINRNDAQVSVFPNPTKDQITFQLQSNDTHQISELKIYTVQGRLLKQFDNESNQILADLSLFSSGVFLYRLHTANGSLFSGKFVLQK